MKPPRLRRTAANLLSPRPDLTTNCLGADRCDTQHPIRPLTSCSLPVGHGAFHQCSTRDGEGHEWGMKTPFLLSCQPVLRGCG